jgi:hypothetical protein
VRLHHSGQYRGVVVPFLQRRLQSTMQPAFDAMNVALKRVQSVPKSRTRRRR